ncbi:hypothetical protein [Alkalicoccus daliensis]|uniref:Uncharacterized protein n=1 Tax=Alkalicoccus daliensis TaxID=745820 RepID=A0A1H0CYT8_9BACI|nr:hypothetical protein [Alkalicoccus daliensis]SDN62956.1 hypothetical protein SAMN04488053_102278 [Alkalicoccus daliensis]
MDRENRFLFRRKPIRRDETEGSLIKWKLLIFFLLAACSNTPEETANPNPEDILSSNPEADIFLYEDVVYANATNIERGDIRDFTKEERIGEIDSTALRAENFAEFTSTALPPGTPLYSTSEKQEPSLYIIAVVEEEDILYTALIEG